MTGRSYGSRSPGGTFGRTGAGENPPDYRRILALLTDAELADEIAAGRGTPDYQAACVAEQQRRQGA